MYGIDMAISLARNLSNTKVFFNTDCLALCWAAFGLGHTLHQSSEPFFQGIQALLKTLSRLSCDFVFINRSANKATYWVASNCRKKICLYDWCVNTSFSLTKLLLDEDLISFFRFLMMFVTLVRPWVMVEYQQICLLMVGEKKNHHQHQL